MIRKRYTPTQKAAIVLELLKEEDTLPQIAARHGIHPNLLRKWKAHAQTSLPDLFRDDQAGMAWRPTTSANWTNCTARLAG